MSVLLTLINRKRYTLLHGGWKVSPQKEVRSFYAASHNLSENIVSPREPQPSHQHKTANATDKLLMCEVLKNKKDVNASVN